MSECMDEATESARAKWAENVRAYRIEDAKIEPMVTLIANDRWLEFTARYVVDYEARRGAKDVLFTRIIDAFDATVGKVAMASMTVHFVEWPALDVRLSRALATKTWSTRGHSGKPVPPVSSSARRHRSARRNRPARRARASLRGYVAVRVAARCADSNHEGRTNDASTHSHCLRRRRGARRGLRIRSEA